MSTRVTESPLRTLAERLRERFPILEAATDEAPDAARGVSFLDVSLGEQRVVVSWTAKKGFGVSARPDVAYGEGPDEVFGTLDATLQRIERLFLSSTTTSGAAPPDDRDELKRMRLQLASLSKSVRSLGERVRALESHAKNARPPARGRPHGRKAAKGS